LPKLRSNAGAGIIHQFWTVGAPLPATIIINRAMKQQALVPS
jgi:hypothetical protein